MWVVKCRWDEWVNPFYCLLPSAYHFFLVSVGEQAYHIQAHDEQQWYPSTPDVFLISCCSKAASVRCHFLTVVLLWLDFPSAFTFRCFSRARFQRRHHHLKNQSGWRKGSPWQLPKLWRPGTRAGRRMWLPQQIWAAKQCLTCWQLVR